MPTVDSHTPGTICWVDLATTDLEAVTPFYLGLFGWEPYDTPMPDGQGTYRFFRLDGRAAAAAGPISPELRAQGVPSHWNVWVAGHADEVTAKAGRSCWSPPPSAPRAGWPWSPTRAGPPSGSGRPASTRAPGWSTSRGR